MNFGQFTQIFPPYVQQLIQKKKKVIDTEDGNDE